MRRERHNARIVGEVIARLRHLRNTRSISQLDVYIDTDINIARIESGKGNVSISTLADLCDYYRITLSDFFEMSVPPAPAEHRKKGLSKNPSTKIHPRNRSL